MAVRLVLPSGVVVPVIGFRRVPQSVRDLELRRKTLTLAGLVCGLGPVELENDRGQRMTVMIVEARRGQVDVDFDPGAVFAWA